MANTEERKHGEIVRAIAQSSSILVLVYDHVQPPVQPIFHAPVLADHFVQSLGR